ncbi:MAG: glutamate 5-kinase [Gammaproteobacteria bacterium]|nr:glutamate 5-kinase [Gammaproteobacteria bacterium]
MTGTEGEKGAFDLGKVWVVKIGSSLLTNAGAGLSAEAVSGWVDDIARLHARDFQIVLVSSGAVAEGMSRLGMQQRPGSVHLLQAAAAVGQMGLVQMYESHFQRHSLHTAQVLLTHDDLRDRERYLNARSTLRALLELGVVPVVNENDTVVTDEIRFGDNDTLAALVANLIQADTLLILTDQRGLFDKNPREHADARLIPRARAGDTALLDFAGEGSALGRGGMVTKLEAARVAARSGATTVITAGATEGVIRRLEGGEVDGTLLEAGGETLALRKQWLAALPAKGTLTLDAGAVDVLRTKGRSLLPIGVTAVAGQFRRGEMVACVGPAGGEIARGLVNYGHEEAAMLLGKPSSALEATLGYQGAEELIHRDDLVIS